MHPDTDDLSNEFDALFAHAESHDAFHVSAAKLRFTEDMLANMEKIRLSKSELAAKLGVKPAQISRLCSGRNNFTLETMVKIARALGCEFKSHLQPAGTTTQWIDLMKEEPVRPPVKICPVIQISNWADNSFAQSKKTYVGIEQPHVLATA